jgi:uncharacterized delta-60 repeat protein
MALLLLGVAILLVAFPSAATAAAGDLDPSFSGDGIATDSRSCAWDVAFDSSDRIVVTCFGFVSRFRANGKLDQTFSGNGRAKLPFDADAIATDARDRVVVGGYAPDPQDTHHLGTFAVARLKANAKPDPSFSGDGEAVTQIGGFFPDRVTGVAIDHQGRIVAAGGSIKYPRIGEFAVARYLASGKPDNSFSGDGQTRTRFRDTAGGYAVAIDSKGRIVVAGNEVGSFAVARYTPAGNLDRAFSQDGTVTTEVRSYNGLQTLAVDDLDRIVVGGDDPDGFVLLRYRPNGTLDPAFSGDGMASSTTFGYGFALNYGLAIDDQRRVIASGLASNSRIVFALARFTPSGALDPRFGENGLVTTSIGPDARGRGVALDSQGRILVAGSAQNRGAVVARYLGG